MLFKIIEALVTKLFGPKKPALLDHVPVDAPHVDPPEIPEQRLNDAGFDLIKSFEGLSQNSYPDDASPLAKQCIISGMSLYNYIRVPNWQKYNGSPWTIGYGATGKDIHAGLTWTVEQCEARLREELEEHEGYVEQYVRTPLTDNQFAALTSFCYNVGPANLERLVISSELNAGKPECHQACADGILKYDKARGQTMLGLTRRRKAERELFLKK